MRPLTLLLYPLLLLVSACSTALPRDSVVHTDRSLHAIQVDAAINCSAGGGALLEDGQLVGPVFQTAPDEQNMGQAIPLTALSVT